MQGIIRDAVMTNNKAAAGHSKDSSAAANTKINPRLSIDDAFIDRSYSFRVNWMKDEKLIHQLKKDNIDIELFKCEMKEESNENNNKTVKSRLLLFLESNPIQIIIALLVLVDAGIVIAEIILEIHSLKNSIEAHEEQHRETIYFMNRTFTLPQQIITHLEEADSHYAMSVMESILEHLANYPQLRCDLNYNKTTNHYNNKTEIKQKSANNDHKRIKRSASSSSSSYSSSYSSSSSSAQSLSHKVSEKKHRSQTLHVVSETLHYASIVILGLFVIEVALKIACVGLKFFKAKFEVVDAVVIVTSFVADIIIVKVGSQEISVMIIFLLWRIVRVINGLLMHEKQRDEFRIALQKKARRVSEMKVDQLNIQNEMQEKHIMALEEALRDSGVPDSVIKRCRPKYIQYSKDQTNNPLKSIAAMTTGFMGNLVGATPRSNNKEINRFAASYSPSCTPRNRSPVSQRHLRLNNNTNNTHDLNSPPSSSINLLNAHNVPNQKKVSYLKSNHHTYHSRYGGDTHTNSSINSVFDNHSINYDDEDEDEDNDDDDKTLNQASSGDNSLSSTTINDDCLLQITKSDQNDNTLLQLRDFTDTNHKSVPTITSPFIDDCSLSSASNQMSTSIHDDNDDLDKSSNLIYRCTHDNNNVSTHTLTLNTNSNDASSNNNLSSQPTTRSVDYV